MFLRSGGAFMYKKSVSTNKAYKKTVSQNFQYFQPLKITFICTCGFVNLCTRIKEFQNTLGKKSHLSREYPLNNITHILRYFNDFFMIPFI